ncbi:MAG: dUTP diphosphatase, partial [Aestuariivirga sp.]
MTPLRIMRLANGENLPLPAYESPGAAGMDLRAAEDTV